MSPEEIHEQLPMSRLSTDESPGRPNTSTVSAYESQLEILMILYLPTKTMTQKLACGLTKKNSSTREEE